MRRYSIAFLFLLPLACTNVPQLETVTTEDSLPRTTAYINEDESTVTGGNDATSDYEETADLAEQQEAAYVPDSTAYLEEDDVVPCSPSGNVVQTLVVPATNPSGVTSTTLANGAVYEIWVTGTFTFGVSGSVTHKADANYTYEFYRRVWGWYEYREDDSNLNLVIDGKSLEWLGTTDCVNFRPHTRSPSHTYKLEYVGRGQPVRLSIADSYYGDNSGSLNVTIVRVYTPPVSETLTVRASGATVQSSALQSGVRYEIRCEGTYVFGRSGSVVHEADAEWSYDYYDTIWGWYEQRRDDSSLDLEINGRSYDWQGTTDGVNFAAHTRSPSHVYRIEYVGQGQPIELRIKDSHYGDNGGSLTVTITPL
ncbi:MAG: RHS repeat protein [Phycisphaerae bacterium]|nr:RHS repeat protein [Phycisphaerae bacterium]